MVVRSQSLPSGCSAMRALSPDLVNRVRRFRDDHGLSCREEDVLLLVVSGVHPKGVAEALGCGYESLRTHLRRTYRKIGCSGARELVVRFFSESIADPGQVVGVGVRNSVAIQAVTTMGATSAHDG